MKISIATNVAVMVLAASQIAPAGEQEDTLVFSVVPGESRVISHALSGSRDTALMGYQVLPRVALTCGADFAVLGVEFSGLDLRAGMFGMIEVETADPEPANFLTVPSGPYVWRGILGYSLALSLDKYGRRWLGDRGALEVAVSFRHESEHYTGSGTEVPAGWHEVPNIGDFLMPDLAMRKALGPVDMELRIQSKFFLPSRAYSVGPGADIIFRWLALTWLHPFISIFGEYLIGEEVDENGAKREIPDNYLARGLLGVIVPGKAADIQIFMATAYGHDKGLLAKEEELRIGWGIRIGLFKQSLFRSNP